MILHLFVSGLKLGRMDLDKKLSDISKIYPDATISKRSDIIEYIKASDLKKELILIKCFDKKLNINIHVDLYAMESLAYAYFDIYFEVDLELYELLVQGRGIVYNLFFHSEINMDGEDKGFASILLQLLILYYNFDKLNKIELELDDDPTKLADNIDLIYQKTGLHYYSMDGPAVDSMSLGPMHSMTLIEDYKDEIVIDNDTWEEISLSDESVYFDKNFGNFICKKEESYQFLYEHVMRFTIYQNGHQFIRKGCRSFLNLIRKKGLLIRKNIVENNKNPHYWKELKNEIEVLDLNFLEFHADAVDFSKFPSDRLLKTYDYKEKYDKKNRLTNDLTFQYLNEVKYAISNLSTPSHVHDESILQKETEKVNDRILLLSFIAMAVSAIGMMQSRDIAFELKVISGIAIFSLPAFYYFFRMVQKRLSIRKNRINELNRIIEHKTEDLERSKTELETVINQEDDDFPEGFKKELIEEFKKDISKNEKMIEKIKTKL